MNEENKDIFGELEPTDLSNNIYNIILSIRNNLTLPTHATLIKSTEIAGGILVASLTSYLLDFPTAIEPIGALICFVTLLALSILEGSEDNELSRMYSAAELSARKALRRAKEAGASIKTRRDSNDSGRRKQKATKSVRK